MTHQLEAVSHLFAELAVHDSREGIKRALAATRELVGIDVAYLTRVDETDDTERSELGAVSVPLRFSDGRIYGRLRARSDRPDRTLDQRDVAFLHVLARIIADQLEREEHDLERERQRAESTALQGLIAAVAARDRYTGEHSRKVVDLAVAAAQRLRLDEPERERVERVALLHDVGKVAVPDEVLQKPAALDDDELEMIRRHPVVGAQIVRSVPDIAHLATSVRASHERWDGNGYPDGIAGEEIPMPARITFVCDAYDAMTSDRPYRRALSHSAAAAELRRHAASQFCPHAVNALLDVLGEDPGRPAAAVAGGTRRSA